jgi:ferritin-like metal-binding protein YciE
MAEIKTPRELFLHELGDILYVEERLEQEVLPKIMGEVRNDELRKGLEKHLEQTRQHVENVEEVFNKLGEQPQSEECIGFQGLKKEHEKLVGESAEQLIDLVAVGAVARTEHYEVAAYENLITMARGLDERDVVELLEKNMKDDKETLREVERLAEHLSKEQMKELTEA